MHSVKQIAATLMLTSTLSILMVLPPDAAVSRQVRRSWTVSSLESLFKKKATKRGTRGPLCVIAPNLGGEQQLWSDRPLFVWRHPKAARIQLRLADQQTIVWQQPLTGSETSITYNGVALQPNQTYEVVLFDRQGNNLVEDKLPWFTRLAVDDRTRITTALNTQENQLKNQQKSAEEITAAKAQYLLQQNLVSDAFQVVYAAQSGSLALQHVVQEVSTIACGGETINAQRH